MLAGRAPSPYRRHVHHNERPRGRLARSIFVTWDGLGLVAKRIEHVPHSEPPGVVLRSLNPEYDSRERFADDTRIVGRAVWVSRRL